MERHYEQITIPVTQNAAFMSKFTLWNQAGQQGKSHIPIHCPVVYLAEYNAWQHERCATVPNTFHLFWRQLLFAQTQNEIKRYSFVTSLAWKTKVLGLL